MLALQQLILHQQWWYPDCEHLGQCSELDDPIYIHVVYITHHNGWPTFVVVWAVLPLKAQGSNICKTMIGFPEGLFLLAHNTLSSTVSTAYVIIPNLKGLIL